MTLDEWYLSNHDSKYEEIQRSHKFWVVRIWQIPNLILKKNVQPSPPFQNNRNSNFILMTEFILLCTESKVWARQNWKCKDGQKGICFPHHSSSMDVTLGLCISNSARLEFYFFWKLATPPHSHGYHGSHHGNLTWSCHLDSGTWSRPGHLTQMVPSTDFVIALGLEGIY